MVEDGFIEICPNCESVTGLSRDFFPDYDEHVEDIIYICSCGWTGDWTECHKHVNEFRTAVAVESRVDRCEMHLL